MICSRNFSSLYGSASFSRALKAGTVCTVTCISHCAGVKSEKRIPMRRYTMRIITISRQFGSGGRELGKRMADILGCDYYDREIILALAEDRGMDPDYVQHVLNNHEWHNLPLTFSNSFSGVMFNPGDTTSLLIRQREIIENIAKAGNDCIIVGRDADIILRDYSPFRIFVCADMGSRLARCMKHEEKKAESLRLPEKEIRRNIKKIDRNRAQVREMLTGKDWTDGSSFDLTVNAAGWDIKKLAPAVAEFAERWFEQNET